MSEDAGVFCLRKCTGDYLKSHDQPGVFDWSHLRAKFEQK